MERCERDCGLLHSTNFSSLVGEFSSPYLNARLAFSREGGWPAAPLRCVPTSRRRRSNHDGAGKVLDLFHEVACGRAVGRVVATVGIHESPIGRKDKVSAELEHVSPGLSLVGPPAGEDEAKVPS